MDAPLCVLSCLLTARLAACPQGALGTLLVIAPPGTPGLEDLLLVLAPRARQVELYLRMPQHFPEAVDTVLCLVPPTPLPAPPLGTSGCSAAPLLIIHCELPPPAARVLQQRQQHNATAAAAAHSGPAFLFPAAPPLQAAPPSLEPLAAAVCGGGGGSSSICLLAAEEPLPCALDAAPMATPAQHRSLQAQNLFNVRTACASQRQPLLLYTPAVLRYQIFGSSTSASVSACHLALLPPAAAALAATAAAAAAPALLPTARQGAWDPCFPAGPARGFLNAALGAWYVQRSAWKAPPAPVAPATAAAAAAAAAHRHATAIQLYLPQLVHSSAFVLPAPVPLACMVEALAGDWANDAEAEEGGVHEQDSE